MKKLLFIFISCLTFFILILEVFTYKNILFKHFFISSDVLFVISLVLGWMVLNSQERGNKLVEFLSKYTFFTLQYLFLPISVCYLYFIFLNINHYPNYVFSNYHLQPDLLIRPLLFSLSILLLSYIKKRSGMFTQTVNLIKDPKKQTENILLLVLILALFSYGVFNFMKDINSLSPYVVLSFKNFDKSEQQKRDVMMKTKYGYFYDYIKFVNKIVPSNSSILLPPQKNPWQNEGNQRLSRYFLYPRNIYSAHENNLPSNIEYIEIAWGSVDFPSKSETEYGWPKNKINAETVYIYNFESGKYTEYKGDYDPDKYLKPGVYGLIKTR